MGDAALLSPTIMCTIPLVLGKIYKTISKGANKKGYVFKKVLDFCYNYKLWWNTWGIQTKVFDILIFNKLKIFLVAGWTKLSKEEHLMHPKLKNVCENAFARLFPGDTMTNQIWWNKFLENSVLAILENP